MDIKSIFSELEGKIITLAKTNVTDFVDQATTDGKQLLVTLKDDLTHWTQQLAENKITVADFKTFVLGDQDLVEMSALTEVGLAAAKVDQFKSDLFSLITDTIPQLI